MRERPQGHAAAHQQHQHAGCDRDEQQRAALARFGRRARVVRRLLLLEAPRLRRHARRPARWPTRATRPAGAVQPGTRHDRGPARGGRGRRVPTGRRDRGAATGRRAAGRITGAGHRVTSGRPATAGRCAGHRCAGDRGTAGRVAGDRHAAGRYRRAGLGGHTGGHRVARAGPAGRLGHRGRGRPALGRVLGHGPLDHVPGPGRDVAGQRGRGVTDVPHGDFQRVLALERPPPGQALVGDHAQRVHVGQGRDLGPGRLLRGDVGRRAEHRPGGGELAGHRRAGDAEVGEDQRAVGADEQVAGLDVAVDDAPLVRGVQRVGGLRDQGHRPLRGEPAELGQRAGQRLALDVLHDQVGDLAAALDLALAVVVHVDHARVVDGGHGARLAAEALDEALLLQQGRQQHLDRDGTAQDRVLGLPHVAHAPAGDALVEPVSAAQNRPRPQHVRPLTWPSPEPSS